MAVTCSGIARDPSGHAVPNLKLILRAIGTSATSFDGSELVVTTGADGSYSFPLEIGRYGVFMDFGYETFIGEAVITSTTANDTLNQYLINVEFSSAVGDALADFEKIRNQTVAASNVAKQESAKAKTEADRATTAASSTQNKVPQEHQYNKIRNALRNLYDASGTVHWGKHGSDPINQGMHTDLTTPNSLMWGGGSNGDSETAYPVINVAGHEIHVRGINHSSPNNNRLVFQDAENGTRTVNTSTGVVTQHADATTAFAAASASNVEVIVRRVDLKYGEAFLEVDPVEMFPYGMCKSGLASIDGIATEPSSRPDSYHAAFAGEVVTNKQCVKVAKLTFVQLAKLMSNPKHNWFYNEAGKPTQVRYRDCSRRGDGNGDWNNVDPATSKLLQFGGSVSASVKPQGALDAPRDASNDFFAPTSRTEWNSKPEVGVFTTSKASGDTHAYKGECYALVLCTVPRLNMGAYSHLNPFGANRFLNADGGGGLWYQSSNHKNPTNSLLDCFVNAHPSQGVIGSASGHPDGLLHDAIYASGFNGVIDHRQPAKSPQDNWKESLQGYYAAKVRGVQKLPFTKAGFTVASTIWEAPSGRLLVYVNGGAFDFFLRTRIGRGAAKGELISVAGRAFRIDEASSNPTGDYIYLSPVYGNAIASFPDGAQVVLTRFFDTSVSGAFTCNTVIADPANWVQTPQIAQGVIGVWCPIIGDGTNKSFPYVRKLLSQSSGVGTDNNGTSWWSASFGGFDSVTNAQVMSSAATSVRLMSYKAYAYQVEDGENLDPIGGDFGVESVAQFARYDYSLLMEGMIHKVGVSNSSKDLGSLKLTALTIDHSNVGGSIAGKISTSSNYAPTHSPVDMVAPTNNSPACKALPFLVEKNGYLYIAWHVNELGWDSTTPTDLDGKLGSTLVANKKYRVNTGASYLWVTAVKSGSNVTFNNFAFLPNGEYRNAGNELWAVSSGYVGDWGDDSKIKVTSKGWDTFVDLNGNTMTRRVVISTFPIGPTKKKTLVGGLSSPA